MRTLVAFIFVAITSTAQDYPKGPPRVELGENYIKWKSLGYNEPSTVTIGPPQVQDAWATVVFVNTMVHNQSDDFHLTYEGLRVDFKMVFGVNAAGAEGIHTLPPVGFIARPDYIEVLDNDIGVIHIYRYIGG